MLRESPLRDLPEWFEEVYGKSCGRLCSSAHRDAPASFSRESASEPRRKVVSGKHRKITRFPKDSNSDTCLRTKITRAPWRKRSGAAVLRAEKFDDCVPAGHKVFSEGCESRHNHRYALVVQDLDTQWIQAYPCKMKKSPRGSKAIDLPLS